MNSVGIGIVVALYNEAAVLTTQKAPLGTLWPLAEGSLWLSGMGPQAAHQAALALAEQGATALAVFGVAGSLVADLPTGTLVCPTAIVDEQGQSYAVDEPWRNRLLQCLRSAQIAVQTDIRLVSLPTALPNGPAKQAAYLRYAASVVDMESAAVAQVAKERGLAFLVLRAIIDERDDVLPETLLTTVDAYGRPRLARLIGALARQPALVMTLPGLSGRMRKALQALREAVAASGTGLAYATSAEGFL